MPSALASNETLADEIHAMREEQMSWSKISHALGKSREYLRSVYRTRYGDKRSVIRGGVVKSKSRKSRAAVLSPRPALQEEPEGLEGHEDFDIDSWLKFLKTVQIKHNELSPMTLDAKRVIRTTRPIAIQFVSCWHLGSRFAQYDTFQEHFDRLLRVEGLYWGVHGDEYDNFTTGFPSAEAIWNQLIPPAAQRHLVKAIISRLAQKSKIMYACWSNHTGFDEKRLGENLVKPIYMQNHIPFFDGKGALRLQVGQEEYILYVAHEFPGSSQWNRLHAQTKALHMEMPSADVVAMGDKHIAGVQKIYHHQPEFEAGRRAVPYSYLIQTGTAKAGPDPYTIRNWTSGIFEWPTLVFYPNRHMVKLVDDLDDLEYFLSGKQ